MKLKLTKKWYEEHAKLEHGCADIAAGASLRSIGRQSPAKNSNKPASKTEARKVAKTARARRSSKSAL